MAESLKSLLTPSLFTFLVNARMPLDRSVTPNFAHEGRKIFVEDHFGPAVRSRALPALQAIASLGLAQVPDLAQFLPPARDPSFPEQALGLILLLDQTPRALFEGTDTRYVRSYFDFLAQRLVATLLALPTPQRPDTWATWEASDASFGWWMLCRFWFGAPLVHAESVTLQERGVQYTNETRETVEARTGTRDTNRDDPSVWTDVHAFPRTYMAGPPEGDVRLEDFAFWMCRMMDIHKCIIDKYGRYPYVNWQNGRVSTPEEEEWIKEEPMFQRVDEVVKKWIREDVLAGRWTPLGEGPRGRES